MGNKSSKRKLKAEKLEELHKKVPNMNMDEIQKVYENFLEQSGGRKCLSERDFKKVYKEAFGQKAAVLASGMFRAFDVDGNGEVNFEEFLVGLSLTDTRTGDTSKVNRLRWAFNVYDKDRSNTIDIEEMRNIVKAVFDLTVLPELMPGKTAIEFADELFREVDINGDGEITFEEFVEAANKNETIIDLLLPAPPGT